MPAVRKLTSFSSRSPGSTLTFPKVGNKHNIRKHLKICKGKQEQESNGEQKQDQVTRGTEPCPIHYRRLQ